MAADEFHRKYHDLIDRMRGDYEARSDALEQQARRAYEQEERRVLANVERLIDAPGREGARAFRRELEAIERRAPKDEPTRERPQGVEDLGVRSLHLLARLDSELRHSIVEACLMNLRGYADALDEKASDPTFVGRLVKQIALLPMVGKQVVDFFSKPRVAGMSIRDLLPLPAKLALASVRSVLEVVDLFRGRKADGPPIPGRELAMRLDGLSEALGEVRKSLDHRRLALGKIASDAVETLRGVADAQGATLELEADGGAEIRLFLDAAGLTNAVGELVRNALKHGQRAGRPDVRIRVAVREDPPPSTEVRIVVADDGPGFDEAVLAGLGARGVSTSGGGDGMGLVRQSAEAHFGRVEVASESGRGAQVSIVLPRHPQIDGEAPRA